MLGLQQQADPQFLASFSWEAAPGIQLLDPMGGVSPEAGPAELSTDESLR